LAAGCVVTLAVAFTSLWIGHRFLRIPTDVLTGMVAGIHTQPAVLGFALERSGDDQPNVGYAAVFPTATIVKIIAGQLLLAALLH
jgi:putative transport protein